jgi:hypothetical protein
MRVIKKLENCLCMKHQMHYWAVYTQCHSLHKLYSITLLD